MDVESRRKFQYGFVLREIDLRRLINEATEELQKIAQSTLSPPRYRMKFRNGVFADTASIDQVLEHENCGSTQISRLECHLSNANIENGHDEPSNILLEFINADLDDEPGNTSLRWHVFGHNRDWVFVTSSRLEDRFKQIKRFSLNQISRRTFQILPLMLLQGIILITLLLSQWHPLHKPTLPSEMLERAWHSGEIREPISAMVFLQAQIENRHQADEFSLLKPLMFFMGLIVAAWGVWLFFISCILSIIFAGEIMSRSFKEKNLVGSFGLEL